MIPERHNRCADEIVALQAGADLGMTLIDTAEMYGDGAAETLIGEAVGHIRHAAASAASIAGLRSRHC